MRYKKFFISVIILVIFLFMSYSVVTRIFSNKLNIRVAIVDSDKVIRDSLALQNIQQQIKEQSSELQEEFESELEKFKPSKEEFELLSEEAKKQKTEQFDKYALSVRDSYTKKMLFLEKSYTNALDNIFNKIKEIAKEIAEKDSIDLVFFISKKNQILYFMDDIDLDKIDLSDLILNYINKEIPRLALKDFS
ncbi:MAG: OmpH family outer membrane protein [Wolbachia endosymbiont of Meromenopon meropis]|nr:OmpH family outer membrane protein [Wolbachia endosymbiont of Meromenopon meropis]